MRTRTAGIVLACLALLAAAPASAALVGFEAIPDGTPSELLPIGDQFLASDSVSFRLEGTGPASPVLAQMGGTARGFVGPPLGSMPDTVAAGQPALGSFFLTDDGSIYGVPRPLRITFSVPMASVGALLLDVDRTSLLAYEAFRIDLFDDADLLLDSLTLTAGMPGAGDGMATAWRFDRVTPDIRSLLITYVGTTNPAIGWGLDNLFVSNAPVPEPGTLLLSWIGVTALGGRRRSRSTRAGRVEARFG